MTDDPLLAGGSSAADARAARPEPTPDYGDLALVLTGGGARGAYQVGVLRCLARRYPQLRIPILTGVSAGAVNSAYLAQHGGTLPQAVDNLSSLWRALTPERVFRVDAPSLWGRVLRWGVRLVSGGVMGGPRPASLMDNAPLRHFLAEAMQTRDGTLPGIEMNLERGVIRAVALSTTSYTTGQSITWVQGREITQWERPKRRGVQTRLTIDHIMASTALPLIFPAVRLGAAWYGDGGIRLSAPLSPALHLGAHKILAISTRRERSRADADQADIPGYPPPAQVLGVLYNAIFLDLIDQDVIRLERLNQILRGVPPPLRQGLRIVNILTLRPSRDLGRMARDYEVQLPRVFRFLTRGLGTRETASPDILSMVMFQDDYIRALIELGEADADARVAELDQFLAGDTEDAAA